MENVKELKKELKQIRVLIGIPTRGDFRSDMAMCLVHLINAINSAPVIELGNERALLMWYIHTVQTSILPQSRQQMIDIACDDQNKIDYLLFLDDDMVFPSNLLHEWILADRAVIAANCPTRGSPTYPTARNKGHEPKGKMVYSDAGHGRFEKVWRVGTGIMLMRKDAFKALPRPAFTPRWDADAGHYVGEDWVMVEHLEAAGIPVYVDHEISMEIQHIGSMHYTHAMVGATRRVEAKVLSQEPGIIVPSRIVPDGGGEIEVAR